MNVSVSAFVAMDDPERVHHDTVTTVRHSSESANVTMLMQQENDVSVVLFHHFECCFVERDEKQCKLLVPCRLDTVPIKDQRRDTESDTESDTETNE